MEEIEITIMNWDKYNPRVDVKRPHWFRLQNGMWRDSQFFTFGALERWVWICILSHASEKQSKTISINKEWFCRESGVTEKVLDNTIEKLTRNACVTRTLRGRNADVTRTLRGRNADVTLHNITGHNRTEQDTTKTFSSELADASPRMTEFPVENFILNLSLETRNRIEVIYPDRDFVCREVEKMKSWIEVNPKKVPKSKSGWSRFVLGWLDRGWDRYRKSLPTEKPQQKDFSDYLKKRYENGQANIQPANAEAKKPVAE